MIEEKKKGKIVKSLYKVVEDNSHIRKRRRKKETR